MKSEGVDLPYAYSSDHERTYIEQGRLTVLQSTYGREGVRVVNVLDGQ